MDLTVTTNPGSGNHTIPILSLLHNPHIRPPGGPFALESGDGEAIQLVECLTRGARIDDQVTY